jgi:HlyD family secretion protein
MAEKSTPEQAQTMLKDAEKISYGENQTAEAYAKKSGFFKKWKERIGARDPKKGKHHWVRWVILIAIAAALIFALVKVLGGGEKTTSEVITDTVQYGAITSTVEGSGLTKPKESKAITLTTAGTVQEVYVQEGDHVTEGQQLFSIDSPAARTAVQTAQSTYNGYEKQMRALQKDLAGLNLSAPYAGKLMETVSKQAGDTITKGDVVAKLVDDTKLLLKQYYSYAYQGEIRAGQTATISLPAMATSVSGKVESVHMVSRITPEGSKLFEADIVVTNPGTLTADMAASATVSAGGETVYPYEAGKLEYYRSTEVKSTVSGTVIFSNLIDYLSVTDGQVLVKIDGEDSENDIFTLQRQLDTAEQDLKKAQENLDNMNAVAPINGTVIGLAVAPGDELSGTAVTAITIADTTTMLIDATVDERNISYVQMGMMVDITDWSGNTYMGMIENVSLTSTVTNGVASYPMSISVDNTDGTVVNGSNVNYSLVASQNDNCLVVPIQSVKYVQMDDGSTPTVLFVQSGSRPDTAMDLPIWPDDVPESGFWAVPVEIGISDDYNVEIKSGVEEGETIFTAMQTTSSWG